MSVALFDRRRTPRERRVARRAPFVASVRSSAVRGAPDAALALAVDLSESGMRLRCLPDAPGEGFIHLEFELPDGRGPIHAIGRLLGAGPDGAYHVTGVRFIGLDGSEAARIADYVAVHA